MVNTITANTVRFYTTPTPYQSYRLIASKNILEHQTIVDQLNFFCVWGGIDKKTDKIVSWEFSTKFHTDYLLKILNLIADSTEVDSLALDWH